jgi:hypothetical protein
MLPPQADFNIHLNILHNKMLLCYNNKVQQLSSGHNSCVGKAKVVGLLQCAK